MDDIILVVSGHVIKLFVLKRFCRVPVTVPDIFIIFILAVKKLYYLTVFELI